jgi:hypothetical protein
LICTISHPTPAGCDGHHILAQFRIPSRLDSRRVCGGSHLVVRGKIKFLILT